MANVAKVDGVMIPLFIIGPGESTEGLLQDHQLLLIERTHTKTIHIHRRLSVEPFKQPIFSPHNFQWIDHMCHRWEITYVQPNGVFGIPWETVIPIVDYS